MELVAGWMPGQPWFEGDAGAEFVPVGAFRFDDPEGEVGIETILVRAGNGPVLQVPLTYRGAPLEGGEAALIETMEHSVLGRRWVYDATGDPAYLAAVAEATLSGGIQAEQYIEVDGERVPREITTFVVGSGTADAAVGPPPVDAIMTRHEGGATVVEAGGLRLVVARVPAAHDSAVRGLSGLLGTDAVETLYGTWQSEPRQHALVVVARR